MKKIPSFKDEKAERAFWAKHDSSEYVDWSRGRRVSLPALQPSVRTISLRLPESMLDELKVLANRDDVPYQSLIKIILAERIRREQKAGARSRSPAVRTPARTGPRGTTRPTTTRRSAHGAGAGGK